MKWILTWNKLQRFLFDWLLFFVMMMIIIPFDSMGSQWQDQIIRNFQSGIEI